MDSRAAMNSELFLVQRIGPTALSAFRLISNSVVVGRSSRADICLPDATVSRRHARFEITNSCVDVHDLRSRNGTFVDDYPVQSSPVRIGQQIRFGSVSVLLASTPDGNLETDSEIETIDPRDLRTRTPLPIPKELTPAQLRVLDLFLKGDLEKQVAKKLGISQHTVHNHAREIYRAYQVHSRAELMLRAASKADDFRMTVIAANQTEAQCRFP